MFALPAALAVTTPLLTVATAVLLLAHVTALLVALLGATVAFNVKLAPSSTVTEVLSNVTPVTATLTG